MTWIPPWVAIKSSRCARVDCNELRHADERVVRRYCQLHAEQYEREAYAAAENEKLLWFCSDLQCAGVPGSAED